LNRKEQTLNAASLVFEKYGLSKTKLDDIAKECGIKKTAVYYYFKNKDEIIKTMFLRDIEKLKSQVITRVNKQKTATAKIETYLKERTESIRYMMKYFDLFIKEDAPLSHRELAMKVKKEILQEEVDFLKEIIQNGVKNKEFKSDFNVQSVIYLLLGSTHTLGLEELFYSKKLNIKKETSDILTVILEGIRRK